MSDAENQYCIGWFSSLALLQSALSCRALSSISSRQDDMAKTKLIERVDIIEAIVFLTVGFGFHAFAKWVYHLDECVLSFLHRWLHGFI